MGMEQEERELLRDSARAFLTEIWTDVASKLPPGSTTPSGDVAILRRTWQRAAAQSWIGVEAEADTLEVVGILQEETGRAACPLPLADAFVALRWSDEARRLAIAEGRCWPVVVCAELDTQGSLRFDDRDRVSFVAPAIDGIAATDILLLDRASGQAWWVEVDQEAVGVSSQIALGQPILARIVAEHARAVRAEARPGETVFSSVVELRLLLAARALGAGDRMRELVVDYSKLREQFGQPIGRFQAVQHKLANVLIATESSRTLIEEAVRAFDERIPDAVFWADLACAYCGDHLRQAGLEVQHAFGAIGYMEEHEAPAHFRRTQIDLLRAGGPRAACQSVAKQLVERVRAGRRGLPDFPLPASAEKLQKEVRDWLGEHWSDAVRKAHLAEAGPHAQVSTDMSRAIGKQGWIAPTLSAAHGGRGLGDLENFVIKQAMFAADVPTWFHGGAELVVHGIAHFGSDAQHQRWLPSILEGNLCVALGYSEPGAGSDLASLKTRGERTESGWRINGQKIWTSSIEFADYIWTAVRTDPDAPRHKGISIFMIPRDTPGLHYQRLKAMNGHVVGAVFFDDVEVDDDALIGQPSQGWSIINAALATERITMGAGVEGVVTAFDELIRLSSGHGGADGLHETLAGLAADLQAARALAMRAARHADAGGLPLADAAISKIASGEVGQRMAQLAIDIQGPVALLSVNQTDACADGAFEALLRHSVMMIVGGGSAEIQRNIIAQQVLGLPR
jgi:3-oxo-4-pregnene-20-carboxyl-CoA dehydrogenase beta subunit